MKRFLKIAVPASMVLLLLGVTWAPATEEIGREESTECTACHDKPGSKLLTDRGYYYETMRSLDGFDEIRSFGRCTKCHVRKPGSKKLTRTGRRVARVVDDMAELERMLEEGHPVLGDEEEEKD